MEHCLESELSGFVRRAVERIPPGGSQSQSALLLTAAGGSLCSVYVPLAGDRAALCRCQRLGHAARAVSGTRVGSLGSGSIGSLGSSRVG